MKEEEDVAAVPLAFDLKKCHFKYAILLLEETLERWRRTRETTTTLTTTAAGSERERRDVVRGERMIVRILNSDVKSPGVGPGGSGERTAEGAVRTEGTQRAHVRLVRRSNADSSGATAELFSVSASGRGRGEEESSARPIDPSAIDVSADWNVARSFPLRPSSDSTPATSRSNEARADSSPAIAGDDVPGDIFLSELRKKQSQLHSLESDIERSSRAILSKAYAEHSVFAAGDHLLLAERDRRKLAEYKAVQTRLREAEQAWQAQLDQDMDAVCDVCHDGEVTPENQIIFCDACNVAVHQRCYGIDTIPSGAYFCHACRHFEVDKEVSAARQRGGAPASISRPSVVCELCPRRQGAFVEVQCKVATKKARWVHVGCAKWQGMNYVDPEKKDKIEDLR